MPDVREWGRREYADALAEMRALRAARRRGEIPDTLLLVEHPPVLTVGVQGAEGDTLPPELPVFSVERGGHSTYHGPGQLVGYPIVDLEPRGKDVRRFVRDVEQLVVDGLEAVGIRSGRVEGQRGVWVDGRRKIASVGIAVEEWVTSHGFAVNVATDLSIFRRFRPCGFDGSVMTSASAELGRTVDLEEVAVPIRASWRRRFAGAASPPAESLSAVAP